MKFNTLKKYMDLTEDLTKSYRTKHGKGIPRSELGTGSADQVVITATGEESRQLTVALKAYKEAKEAEAAAKKVMKKYLPILKGVKEKLLDDFENAHAVLLESQSFLATFNKDSRSLKDEINWEDFYDILMLNAKGNKELTEYYEAVREKVTEQVEKTRRGTIQADNIWIKSEGIMDYLRDFWKSFKAFILPHRLEAERLIKQATQDYKTVMDEFKQGMEQMIDNPDYHIQDEELDYDILENEM